MDPILAAQIFALLTAIGFAAGDTAVHFALRTSTPMTGILTLAIVTLLIYGPIGLATYPLADVTPQGLWVFLAAGVASPGLAGTLLYMSFRRLGLSRSVSVVSCAPLITVLFGVVLLGERPTFLVYVGTLLLGLGVMFLAREQRSSAPDDIERKSVWHYFAYAVLATLMFGLTAVFRKIGVAIIPNLSVGLSIAALGSLIVVLVWHPFLPPEDRIRIGRRDIWFFVISGACSSSGHLSFFAALQRGPLYIVAPLVYASPLFALIFSWIFFRTQERLNSRVVFGAILICIGAALVTLSRR